MALLYERKETPDEIIIVYKYWPLFYIILTATLILSFILEKWANILWAFFGISVIIFIADIWKPNKEIRKAMREDSVQVSGSKFSFSKPFTAVIKKKGS